MEAPQSAELLELHQKNLESGTLAVRKKAEAAGLVKHRSVAQSVHRSALGRSSAPIGSSAAVASGSSSDATWLLTVISACPPTAIYSSTQVPISKRQGVLIFNVFFPVLFSTLCKCMTTGA